MSTATRPYWDGRVRPMTDEERARVEASLPGLLQFARTCASRFHVEPDEAESIAHEEACRSAIHPDPGDFEDYVHRRIYREVKLHANGGRVSVWPRQSPDGQESLDMLVDHSSPEGPDLTLPTPLAPANGKPVPPASSLIHRDLESLVGGVSGTAMFLIHYRSRLGASGYLTPSGLSVLTQDPSVARKFSTVADAACHAQEELVPRDGGKAFFNVEGSSRGGEFRVVPLANPGVTIWPSSPRPHS